MNLKNVLDTLSIYAYYIIIKKEYKAFHGSITSKWMRFKELCQIINLGVAILRYDTR